MPYFADWCSQRPCPLFYLRADYDGYEVRTYKPATYAFTTVSTEFGYDKAVEEGVEVRGSGTILNEAAFVRRPLCPDRGSGLAAAACLPATHRQGKRLVLFAPHTCAVYASYFILTHVVF